MLRLIRREGSEGRVQYSCGEKSGLSKVSCSIAPSNMNANIAFNEAIVVLLVEG